VYGGIVYYRYLSTIAVTEMIAFGIGYPEAFMRRSLNEISIGLIFVIYIRLCHRLYLTTYD
jgi:hypothetical protein